MILKAVFLANICSTLFMTGLIWLVQVVNYPLMAFVTKEGFGMYHQQHVTRITWVVAVPMLIELATSFILIYKPYPGLPKGLFWAGGALVLLIWLSTSFSVVPVHNKMELMFSPDICRQLVASNWLRTVCWTLKSAIAFYCLSRLI